jgi:hypothetical protein
MIAALHYITLRDNPRIHTATLIGTENGRRIFTVGDTTYTEGIDCTVTNRHAVNVETDPRVDLAEGNSTPVTVIAAATVDLIARVPAAPYVPTGHDGLCFCLGCLDGANVKDGGE